MVNERRGPRLCLDPDHRSLFGKSNRVIWIESSPPGELAAAYQQHLVSYAVRQALRDSGQTIEQLARDAGLGIETLRRKLRGEVWMSLTDMATLELTFPEVHSIRTQSELLPK